jgi:hypothetical protein
MQDDDELRQVFLVFKLVSRNLGNGVPEYSLLNHDLAESRTLPDSAIIPISEILDTAILLNKIFSNSELAGEGKLKAN